MASRVPSPDKYPPPRSYLERWRRTRGVTQTELAEVAGISIAQYRRLERRELANPPIGYFRNLAIALQVNLEDIAVEWLDEWYVLGPRGQSEPPPEDWFERLREQRERG